MNTQAEQYLQQHPTRLIQLGAGGNFHPGWLNTDGQCDGWYDPAGLLLDASRPFDLPDQSFDRVFSEHMIEHLDYAGGLNMLQESYRILRPGGRIRITCPPLEGIIDMALHPERYQAYLAYLLDPVAEPVPDSMYIANKLMRFCGHKHIWSRTGMRLVLEAVGFEAITEHAIQHSDDPVFRNLECAFRFPDYDPARNHSDMLQAESMTFEATRPE